jgi:hypothetical protein
MSGHKEVTYALDFGAGGKAVARTKHLHRSDSRPTANRLAAPFPGSPG